MIDLMSNITFTPDEINARVVSIIRQQYSLETEQKITRIAVGALQNTYTPTVPEKQLIADYQVYVEASRATGVLAAKDNDLLIATIEHEAAVDRLAQPTLLVKDYPKVDAIDPLTGKPTGTKIDAPEIIADKAERKAAQATVKIVSAATKALVEKRLVARKAATGGVI